MEASNAEAKLEWRGRRGGMSSEAEARRRRLGFI
jgi:hypothetical protein